MIRSQWSGAALFLFASAAPAQSAALTPLGAPAEADPTGEVGPWLPGEHSPAEMQALIRDDTPLRRVDRELDGGYGRYLSAGHRALLAAQPGYRLTVYPSRRVAYFPEAINAASLANRKSARLNGSTAIAGVRLGIPFLVPSSGLEAMWNHRLRYRGDSSDTRSAMRIVDPGGPTRPVQQRKVQLNVYANLSPAAVRDILFYNYRAQAGSRFSSNYLVLQHEPMKADITRGLWVRQVTGKMLRVSNTPADLRTGPSQGIMSLDMHDMFGGEGDFSLYTWKLVGKRTTLIPYNAIPLSEGAVDPSALTTPFYPNADFLRYELHRTWVVEASLLPGKRHLFPKRVFYLDEDSWLIALAESYSADGALVRFQECHAVQDFEHSFPECRPTTMFAPVENRYLIDDLLPNMRARKVNVRLNPSDFSPARASNVPTP